MRRIKNIPISELTTISPARVPAYIKKLISLGSVANERPDISASGITMNNIDNNKRRRRRRRKKISSKFGRLRPNPSKQVISHHRDYGNNNLEPQASHTQHHQRIYKGGSDYLEDDFMEDFESVPTTGRTQDFTEFMNF